jgi:hypothetical protein
MTDDHGVPASGDDMLVVGTLLDSDVDEICRRPRIDWSFDSKDFSRYNLSQNLVILVYRDIFGFKLLVSRVAKLVLFEKIHPELESNGRSIKASWYLSMHDAFASSHPLHMSWHKCALVSKKIFVFDLSTKHVSDSLHTTMRVVRESCWQLDINVIHH